MMTDPIADMLTRIRNASMARLEQTELPLSKIKLNLAKILKGEGFITDYSVGERTLTVQMKYNKGREPVIVGIKRTSRPGRRVYVSRDEVPKVMNGLGVAILSTSHGVMTDASARKAGVGGEVVCEVW